MQILFLWLFAPIFIDIGRQIFAFLAKSATIKQFNMPNKFEKIVAKIKKNRYVLTLWVKVSCLYFLVLKTQLLCHCYSCSNQGQKSILPNFALYICFVVPKCQTALLV